MKIIEVHLNVCNLNNWILVMLLWASSEIINSEMSLLFLGLRLNLQKAINYLLEFLANESNILKLEDNKQVINS